MKTMNLHILLLLAVCCFAFAEQSVRTKQKILLDCDLGGDIDDAFAIALILTSPEFEIMGITMDHGLTEKRAQIACKILYQLEMERIPVAVGRKTPNIAGQGEDAPRYENQFYWAEGFDKVKPIAMPAADFIIKTLRQYPKEVILFTVGPVPNIADVLQKDAEALKLAKHIYSMFGSFYQGYGTDGKNPVAAAEWNVRADVASAQAFAAAGAQVTYAGLDVTTFVTLDEQERHKLLMRQSPLTDALCGLYTLWGGDTPVLYDPVAIGMVLWPDLFTTRPAHVRVIEGGFTIVDESKAPNCEIGISIDKEEFVRRLMQRLVRQNLGKE